MHALNATLFAALLSTVGVPIAGASAAAALFALHPANVDPVAWISQLRTLLAMTCGLGALLLLLRASRWSAILFGVGLLFKASSAAVLPAAAALYWSSRHRGISVPGSGRVLVLWVLVFLVYAPLQLSLFSVFAAAPVDPYPDLLTQICTVAAIGGRYLVMAATGIGVSAYHMPPMVQPSLDPWWIVGGLLGLMLAWWTLRTLWRGEPQAAFRLLAVAGFAPISQIIPFTFPIADRYLYFVLPGLIGGSVLAPAWERCVAS